MRSSIAIFTGFKWHQIGHRFIVCKIIAEETVDSYPFTGYCTVKPKVLNADMLRRLACPAENGQTASMNIKITALACQYSRLSEGRTRFQIAASKSPQIKQEKGRVKRTVQFR